MARDEPTRRRAERQRNRRIGAGALAIAVMVVATAVALGAFRFEPTPADRRPTPTVQPPAPNDIGDLAYVLHGDVYVADWDGTDAVRIANGRDRCGYGEYSAEGRMWSPDGNYLAFRYTDCEHPRTGRAGVVISGPNGHIISSFPGEGWRIAWSPDSSLVAIWVKFPRTIGIYNIHGVRQALLTVPRGMMAIGDNDPDWSPDGESVLVPSSVDIPLDGSPARRLAWGPLTYSPDGSRIAYYKHGKLVIAEADGSHPRRVPNGRGVSKIAWSMVWSPTGDQFAFTAPMTKRLWVFDVATGVATPVGDRANYVWALDLSPDDNRVLFSMQFDDSEPSLYSANADGSDPRLIVDGVSYAADWQSQGSKS